MKRLAICILLMLCFSGSIYCLDQITRTIVFGNKVNHSHYLSPSQISRYYGSSVCEVSDARGHGTGFIVDVNLVVAPNHLIGESNEFFITFSDSNEILPGKVVWFDQLSDIALFQVNTGNRKPLQLSNRSKFVIGERIVAIGYPLDLGYTITEGLVSSLCLVPGFSDCNEIVTDARLIPGNSGSPLFDHHGYVVGMCTITTYYGSYNGSIPCWTLRQHIEEYKQGEPSVEKVIDVNELFDVIF